MLGEMRDTHLAIPSTSTRRASSPASLIASLSSDHCLMDRANKCRLIVSSEQFDSMSMDALNRVLGVLEQAILIGALKVSVVKVLVSVS